MSSLEISEYIYKKIQNESDVDNLSKKLTRMTRRHTDCNFSLKSQDRVARKRNYYVICGNKEDNHDCAGKFRIDIQEIADNKRHRVEVYAKNRVDKNWSGDLLVLNDVSQLIFETQDLDEVGSFIHLVEFYCFQDSELEQIEFGCRFPLRQQNSVTVLVHGWKNDKDSEFNSILARALRRHNKQENIIIVDWGAVAKNFNYLTAA